MAIASLGPRNSSEPSRCERNSTPCAWILRIVARLNTWNPPLSVRIGPAPIDEPVQPARGADDVQPGADVEVIGIAEDDLGAHLAQLARVNRLDAALRADGHEDRRIHDAMRRGQPAQARLANSRRS